MVAAGRIFVCGSGRWPRRLQFLHVPRRSDCPGRLGPRTTGSQRYVGLCPVIALGIALSNRCKLPIIPTDLFARDLSEIIRKPYAKVKTTMDLTCVAVSIVLTVVGTGTLKGVGIGTVVAALTYGRTAGLIGNLIDKKFYFVSVLEK